MSHDDRVRASAAFCEVVRLLRARVRPAWAELDLTMTQLKALIAISATGGLTGRAIGRDAAGRPPGRARLRPARGGPGRPAHHLGAPNGASAGAVRPAQRDQPGALRAGAGGPRPGRAGDGPGRARDPGARGRARA